MKLIKIAYVFLLAVLAAAGCTQELTTGIDSSMVPPANVTYDENNSSSTTLGFYWEVDEAIAAGAVSFTAQIVTDEEMGGDVYTGKNSQTFQADSRLNDGAIFSGLSENSKYYARVRANYPRSVFSEWAYVTDSQGRRAVIKMGHGVVEEGIESIVGASAKLVDISSTTAVIAWSLTDFADEKTDRSCPVSIELYRDEACSDIEVSWDITDPSLFSARPAFIFSGLKPMTDYWFVVEASVKTENDAVIGEAEVEKVETYRSEPLKITTTEEKLVRMTDFAQPGQVLLYQDFSELIWGADLINQAIGYSAEKRGSATELKRARGWNPVGGDLGFYVCNTGTEMGLYNTLRKALIGSRVSLTEWAELREDLAVEGVLACRPGVLKLGGNNKLGLLVTPELTGLSDMATIELSFRAAPFGTGSGSLDPLGSCVRILDGTVVTDNIVRSSEINNVVKTFELANSQTMQEYKFEIQNVSNSSRIAIGPKRESGETGQHRMIIDDICIRVKEYGETSITVGTPVVTATAGEGMIMIMWNECLNACSYDVEYKKSADTEWIAAGNTTDLNMTVTGVYPETDYDVRVKAKYSDMYTSEWSETVSVLTSAVTSEITVTAPFITESQIGFRWYTNSDFAADIENPYTLELYKGEEMLVRLSLGAKGVPDTKLMKITGAVQSGSTTMPALWNDKTGPCFLFSGLNPSTGYKLKVTNRNLMISKEFTAQTAPENYVGIPQSAVAGETILFENFGELLWGSLPKLKEYGYGMPGVNSEKRNSLDKFYYISGEQPLENDAYRLWLCAPNSQYGLLNTTWRAAASTRLKDWAAISEGYTGGAAGSLCGMAGMIKLGAGNAWSQIVTPELSCISAPSTIEVSFDMCPHTDDGIKVSDPLDMVVKVVEGVEVATKGDMHQAVVQHTVVEEKTFKVDSDVAFKRYTYTFENVGPGARIAIGTYRPEGAKAGQRRAFLDNVRIVLK